MVASAPKLPTAIHPRPLAGAPAKGRSILAFSRKLIKKGRLYKKSVFICKTTAVKILLEMPTCGVQRSTVRDVFSKT